MNNGEIKKNDQNAQRKERMERKEKKKKNQKKKNKKKKKKADNSSRQRAVPTLLTDAKKNGSKEKRAVWRIDHHRCKHQKGTQKKNGSQRPSLF